MEKSKLVTANEKVAEKVVGIYKKIEDTVVGGYTKIEDAFVDRYLTKAGRSSQRSKRTARIAPPLTAPSAFSGRQSGGGSKACYRLAAV